VLHIYTATGLKGGAPDPDEDEFLTLEVIPFEKAWQMVVTGRIRDSKTVIALQAWKIKLLEKK
jgi:ADP-ribose pyrophosphatase